MSKKIDTKAIGLDVGLGFVKWLTGAENLHYGLWSGLDISAGNLGEAQANYTEKLFGYLPEGPLRILDIGGGAGATAAKLIALGHTVDIVVPSALLADRCRANAPEAIVHEMMFEAFEAPSGSFDLCLFSESFQYIPLDTALGKSLELVKSGGHILIADCFRSKAFNPDGKVRIAGGGHRATAFHQTVESLPLSLEVEEDITEAVAPSIDLEQELFHVFGQAVTRIDTELVDKRPKTRWVVAKILKGLVGERRLSRLDARLRQSDRTSESFIQNNRYLMVRLRKTI